MEQEEAKLTQSKSGADSWMISIHDFPVAPHVPNAKHRNLSFVEPRRDWRGKMQLSINDAITRGDNAQLMQLFNNITMTAMQEIVQELTEIQTHHSQINKKMLAIQIGATIFGLTGMGLLSYITYMM